MTDKKRIWFPARTYGWGWSFPVCWQGWVVLTVFIILILAAPELAPPQESLFNYITYVLALCAALIFICWKKGGKPRWRWRKK